MIRINLLPQAKRAVGHKAPTVTTPANVQAWAIGYFVAALVWIAALAGIYITYMGDLEQQQAANQALTSQIQQLRTRSAQLEEVQAALQKSRALETVVEELNKARTGPTRMLMELSKVLSPAPRGGPTIDPEVLEQMRRDNPLAGYNRGWDPRRLWLTSFQENDGNCRVVGTGRTNEDVAEFLRRLQLSELFDEVRLQKTESRLDPATQLTLIGFELTCTVRY
jgi:type IV pilus assembly protein PilN